MSTFCPQFDFDKERIQVGIFSKIQDWNKFNLNFCFRRCCHQKPSKKKSVRGNQSRIKSDSVGYRGFLCWAGDVSPPNIPSSHHITSQKYRRLRSRVCCLKFHFDIFFCLYWHVTKQLEKLGSLKNRSGEKKHVFFLDEKGYEIFYSLLGYHYKRELKGSLSNHKIKFSTLSIDFIRSRNKKWSWRKDLMENTFFS